MTTDLAADGHTWLDDRQAAVLIGVRRKRIHELRGDHAGSFPRARLAADGSPLWSNDELAAWASSQGVALTTRRLPRAPAPHGESGRLLRAVAPVLTAIAVLGMAILMHRHRLAGGAVNVDDYLYARQTSVFLDSFQSDGVGVVDAWREFGVNSPLVPSLAAAFAAFDPTPDNLVLVQLPLVVALTLTLGALLRRLDVGLLRWPIAGGVAVAAPVLSYTAMLSFSLAATLGVVASLLAYLSSQRLRSRPAAVWLGVALGLLSLSRVVALVYLAALILPMLADLLLDRDDAEQRTTNGIISSLVALAIGAPWWATAGPKAMTYLLDAGYSSESVFTAQRSPLEKVQDRLTHTADETGWLLALAVLGVFALALLLTAVRARRRPDEVTRGLLVVSASSVLGLAGLCTSSNAGTAFALPFLVIGAAFGVAGINAAFEGRHLPLRAVLALVAVAGLALSGFAVLESERPATWGDRELWLSGTPAEAQFESALDCEGCLLPDAERLNREISQRIASTPTLILRADALVNPESLRFFGQVSGRPADLRATAGAALDPASLREVGFAIGGRTAAPYLATDMRSADATLRAAGFCPIVVEKLSPVNDVVLWQAPTMVANNRRCADPG